MPLDVYLGVVAATNMKQRTRKQLEYYHADRLNYAVLGTPNRLEYDQGFFVKNGDGAADIKPIAHLYKTQVYALAAHLGLPEEIRSRPPTTDTWSLAQSQEEFYFSVPYPTMDLCLFGLENGIAAAEVAARAGLTVGAGRDGVARHQGEARRHALSARGAAAGGEGADSRDAALRGGSETRKPESGTSFAAPSPQGKAQLARSHQNRRPVHHDEPERPAGEARAARQRAGAAPSRKQRQHLHDHLQDRAGADAEAERDPERADRLRAEPDAGDGRKSGEERQPDEGREAGLSSDQRHGDAERLR